MEFKEIDGVRYYKLRKEKSYKRLNIIRRIIAYPVKLFYLPLFFLVGFGTTNWEDESDRKFFHDTMRKFYTF